MIYGVMSELKEGGAEYRYRKHLICMTLKL